MRKCGGRRAGVVGALEGLLPANRISFLGSNGPKKLREVGDEFGEVVELVVIEDDEEKGRCFAWLAMRLMKLRKSVVCKLFY